MKRDPRVEPRPGDELRGPSGSIRRVWKMLADGVAYHVIRANGEDLGPGWCKSDYWPTKVADFEIVKVADE